MIDEFGHSLLAGEMYAEVISLQKLLERKKSVKKQKNTKLFSLIPTNFLWQTSLCLKI